MSSSAARVCAFAIAACLASPACADVLALYDASTGLLPDDSDCWSYVASGAIAAPVSRGGAVTLGRTTNGGYFYWEQGLPPLSFDDGASISATVKIDTSSFYAVFPFQRSGYYIQLTDVQGRFAQLGISADRILLGTADQNWSDFTYSFDSTGEFHDYSLVFTGNTVQALIDGEVVLTDTVGSGGAGAKAYFGDMSVLANSLTHTALVTVEGVAECPFADLTCDGVVDGADLGLLLGHWDTASCTADLNKDGVVDGADLGLLLASWSA